jgi:hypothetical protein
MTEGPLMTLAGIDNLTLSKLIPKVNYPNGG